MVMPLLTTKLFIPPVRRGLVARPRLIERLKVGLYAGHRLTLVSAPAGSGKTTLLSEWVATCGRPVAWLALDSGDNDPARFLAYLIAALQTIEDGVGAGVLDRFQAPKPPPIEELLTALINQIGAVSTSFALVLDDYHLITAPRLHESLAFLLDHPPQNMHLVVATRADPPWQFARLRGRGQLTELRLADLQFTPDEASIFLNQVMGLRLSADDVTALQIDAGETVMPGQVVVVLADLSVLRVETTDLSERDVARVAVGQKATVFVEALGAEIQGRVVGVAPQATTVGGDVVYTVYVQLQEQLRGLRWGMSADVEITIE